MDIQDASSRLIQLIGQASEEPDRSEELLTEFASVYSVWRSQLMQNLDDDDEEDDDEDIIADSSRMVLRARVEFEITSPSGLIGLVESETGSTASSVEEALGILVAELQGLNIGELPTGIGHMSAYIMDVRAAEGPGLSDLEEEDWPLDPYRIDDA